MPFGTGDHRRISEAEGQITITVHEGTNPIEIILMIEPERPMLDVAEERIEHIET